MNPYGNNIYNKLIKSLFLPDYEEELKSIQRSIALLRQDIKKIIYEEVKHAIKGESFLK